MSLSNDELVSEFVQVTLKNVKLSNQCFYTVKENTTWDLI